MARLITLLFALWTTVALANGPLRLAVGSEFAPTAEKLAQRFSQQGGGPVTIASGSTGQLATQIANGSPIDLLITSDEWRLKQLTDNGHLLADSKVVIAGDSLMLWSRDYPSITLERLVELPRIAIAEPTLSAYGAASQQVLAKLKLWGKLGNRLSRVDSAQLVFQHVEKGSAPGGLVPRALLVQGGYLAEAKPVPADWHAQLNQQAAIVTAGQRQRAQAFIRFALKEGRSTIAEAGFTPPSP